MIAAAETVARAYFPALVIVLVAGLAIACASRDLGKRLLGAGVAALAGVAGLAVLTQDDPANTTGVLAAGVLTLAGVMLGIALLVHVRESFGGVDAIGLELVEAADDRAERAE